jgi:phosphoglycerate kinase
MRNVKQIKDIKGRVVLVRVDFNVPIENGRVEDDFRVKKALPTIEFLQKKEAKLVLISHHSTPMQTLAPVAEALGKFIKVKFVSEIVGGLVEETVSKMKDGDVILLENLRNDKGEQDCNQIFALNLAKFANLYVNEAFPVSHRGDASIVLLPKLLPAYAGFHVHF